MQSNTSRIFIQVIVSQYFQIFILVSETKSKNIDFNDKYFPINQQQEECIRGKKKKYFNKCGCTQRETLIERLPTF